jgi:hypothetical protein
MVKYAHTDNRVPLLMKNMLLLGIHKFKYFLYYLSTFFVTVL